MNCIGLLTIKPEINYGGIFQLVALQTACSSISLRETVAIDYKNVGAVHSSKGKSFLSLVYQKLYRPLFGDRKRVALSRKFIKENITFSSKKFTFSSLENSLSTYQTVIVGSDQVWNEKVAGDDGFFWPYETKPDHLFSYAASFGSASISSKRRDCLLRNLPFFEAISVREESGKKMLEKLGFQSRIDVDPTLLLSSVDWEKMEKPFPGLSPSSFVFCYLMPGNPSLEKFLRNETIRLAKEKGKTPVIIGNREIDKSKRRKEDYWGVGPAEFLWLVRNADCTLTNSFHGTVFSILFEKDFCVCVQNRSDPNNPNYPDRIIDLCKTFDLSCNIVDTASPSPTTALAFRHKDVSNELGRLAKDSLSYLSRICDD